MKNLPVIIAGAGGIAEALGLILAEWSPEAPRLWIGNRTVQKAGKVANATRQRKARRQNWPPGTLLLNS